jgi:hypothetical protein
MWFILGLMFEAAPGTLVIFHFPFIIFHLQSLLTTNNKNMTSKKR